MYTQGNGNNIGDFIWSLIPLFIIVFGLLGWVNNIWNIVQTLNDPITPLFIFQCVGVAVAPVGAVLGLIIW